MGPDLAQLLIPVKLVPAHPLVPALPLVPASQPVPADPPVPARGLVPALRPVPALLPPAPVALVHVWKSRELSAMADIEAAPSTVTAAHRSWTASHIHASHASRRMGRHEPRSVYRVKQARARAHNEPRQMAGIAARR
jgi:hypothetical protein